MNGKKHDQSKPRFSLLPPAGLLATVEVLEHGAEKYGVDNWKNLEDGERRYADAILRHAFALLNGETHDPETGIHHGAHIACSGLFLAEGFVPPVLQDPVPHDPVIEVPNPGTWNQREPMARGNHKWTDQEKEDLLQVMADCEGKPHPIRKANLVLFAKLHGRTYKAVCLRANKLENGK